MAVSREVPESKFVYVIVAARRARQLQSGSRPLLEHTRFHKATRVAQDELEKGLLEYELPDFGSEGGDREGKRRRG